ncbi:MAG TPA: c-type cytochrome [Chitinophagaceae bacterium]|nr:c-type cytochrome [Chitinophagaceae bacterium]
MRKILLAAMAASLTVNSCADTDKKAKNEKEQKAKEMLSTNRCLTCHSYSEVINGPSYKDIATRYAGRPDTIVSHLVRKVIKGGGGEWGEIYMTPQSHVSQADAEVMVRYILSLKNR